MRNRYSLTLFAQKCHVYHACIDATTTDDRISSQRLIRSKFQGWNE